MIQTADGKFIDAKEDILVHQVNCQGVMNRKVSNQIKTKWPEVYKWYKKRVDTLKGMGMLEKLLGEVQWICVEENRWVVNLFAQYDYIYTEYSALRKGLEKIKDNAELYHQSVAIPYRLGCEDGGGDWEGIVFPMIADIFEKSEVQVTIYQH